MTDRPGAGLAAWRTMVDRYGLEIASRYSLHTREFGEIPLPLAECEVIEAALVREAETNARIAAAYLDAADLWPDKQDEWPASAILDKMPMDARAALDVMLEQAKEDGARETANKLGEAHRMEMTRLRAMLEAARLEGMEAAAKIADEYAEQNEQSWGNKLPPFLQRTPWVPVRDCAVHIRSAARVARDARDARDAAKEIR